MFLRIEFNDSANPTRDLSGTCLTTNAARNYTPEGISKNVAMYHLDVDISNKHFGGAFKGILELSQNPAIKSVDILPITRDMSWLSEEMHYDLMSCLKDYAEGAAGKY